MPAFINEIHYDNLGADAGEAVEIAGTAGTDLTGWRLIFYNGSGGASYATINLSGTIGNQGNGFGTLSFAQAGIQNGSPDGIALIDNLGNVVQFLSYEGVMTATNGPAAGLTSVDIGVTEDGTEALGGSLHLVGTGTQYSDFTWAKTTGATFGAFNSGQTFGAATPSTLSIADAAVGEGNSGSTPISFVVTRTGNTDVATTADYAISFAPGGAEANDFAIGTVFTGSVSFAAGETSKSITLNILGDTMAEGNETFTVTLSNASAGAEIVDGTAIGTITNDDAAPIANVFINEIHYDDAGADAGEAVEVAGVAGTSLAGWSLVFYNGSGGASYGTVALSGTIANQSNGFGTLQFPFAGIQNGAPDGVALVDNLGRVVQFLSYEGVMVATNGPAAGMTSIDIGVSEEGVADGFSLQLVGSGGSYQDFTWTTAAISNTFGTPNTGQTFLAATDPGQIRILDASATEGNSGESMLTFTVRRAGGTALTSDVAYSVVLDGTANGADLGESAILSGTVQFDIGETVKTISVAIQGDTVGEFNETLSIVLNSATNATITDGVAIGTIINDDPLILSIFEIQGESHISGVAGQLVTTTGIVTAVDTDGFYLQDATGDGNSRTSDAIFVFTGVAPAVAVGDSARVTGTITEFRPGNNPDNLTTTQINAPAITVLSSGNALPAATLIGTGGRLPPSDVFDDDQFVTYDPENDAADFYESLEGMRVTIDAPLVTSATNGFGETFVVASGGVGATGVNARGGITISGNENGFDDFNPERIQIDDDSGLFAGFVPGYTQGDRLSNVTGIVNYNFQSYEVLVTEAVTLTTDVGALPREVTALQGSDNRLSIATYNVENLDPGDNKFSILASDIVLNLLAPDIISLNEIQDADGAGSGSNLSGTVTAQGLIDAIKAAGGPDYLYVEVTPATPNSTGGEPGGNIRNGFLYNSSRVSYIADSAVAVPGSAFNGSRSPLSAQFAFNGETITAISVHSTSRGGSDPLFGANQPPTIAGEAARIAQSTAIKAYITDLLSTDPNAYVAVLGDFNAFYFEDALELIEGDVITNLHRTIAVEDRYSFVFEGNAQTLDHILVTNNLLPSAQFDAVHINSEQPDTDARGTDHDPLVATLLFNSAAVAQDGAASGDEDTAIIGTLVATDRNDDVLTYRIASGPTNGTVVLAANGGYIYTPNANFNGTDSFAFTANDGVTDGNVATVSLTVNAINDAPDSLIVAAGGSVVENAATGIAVAQLAATDPDDATMLSYSLVDNAGGRFAIDAATGAVTVANGGLLDFETATSHTVTARVTDQGGLSRDLAFDVAVTDVAEGPLPINGTNGFDLLFGTNGDDVINALGGEDIVFGDSGNDIIFGGSGRDSLNGGAGRDILEGGAGADFLSGGSGQDVFRYTALSDAPRGTGFFGAFNREIILDFNSSNGANGDLIDLSAIDANSNATGDQAFAFVGRSAFSGVAGELRYANGVLQADVNGDRIADLEIALISAPRLDQTDFVL